MAEIQKRIILSCSKRKKKKEPWEIKSSEKAYFHQEHIFISNRIKNKIYKTSKLFQSKSMLEKFIRSIRSYLRLWQIMSIHFTFKQENLSLIKELFKTNSADILSNELPVWIPKWVKRLGDFADSCFSF